MPENYKVVNAEIKRNNWELEFARLRNHKGNDLLLNETFDDEVLPEWE